MGQLVQVVSIIAISSMLGFWAWMFWDMANNKYLPSSARPTWTLAFVFANIFAAIYYYVYEYRDRH